MDSDLIIAIQFPKVADPENPVFVNPVTIRGTVTIIPGSSILNDGHYGILVELCGRFGLLDAVKNHDLGTYDYTVANLCYDQVIDFQFSNFQMGNDTFTGLEAERSYSFSWKYFIRVTLKTHERMPLISERELVVLTSRDLPKKYIPWKLFYGDVDGCHVCLEFPKSLYHIKETMYGGVIVHIKRCSRFPGYSGIRVELRQEIVGSTVMWKDGQLSVGNETHVLHDSKLFEYELTCAAYTAADAGLYYCQDDLVRVDLKDHAIFPFFGNKCFQVKVYWAMYGIREGADDVFLGRKEMLVVRKKV